MKKLLLTSIIMLIAATLLAQKAEFVHKIDKDFAVSKDAVLTVTNKFGNVNIIEGSEGKIVFNIEITGQGATADIAKKIAENVNVNFTDSNNRISAKTVTDNINCSNCSRSINYTITVPPSTAMNFELKHGNLRMDETQKPLNVLMQHGNVNANIVKNAAIDIRHGNVSINKCEELKHVSAHSNLESGYIGNATLDIKHGNCDIKEIVDCRIESRHSNINIENLKNNYTGNIAHGNLNINNISTDFSSIAVEGSFSNLAINLNSSHNFTANLLAEFGSIKLKSVKLNPSSHAEKDGMTTKLKGIAGKLNNPKAKVMLSTKHGNISFK